ncbi:selenide, water dikinase SelD [Limimaricola pyoseonensis]|uniref:Selenophosphate synthase n=1 Tax=Limimaricola pyoseonensis TaxID=521013 RepID=A0A1G7ECF2_9RHOB|nr:selenide, water dikinase SelD [Limimaricola pyoseonensis]SDE61085.1 selenophosphate synthase [Limimaricola pyoseonensis]
MTPLIPLTRDLVLIGGGHAHALLLRRWGMDPLPGVRVTLIDPGPLTAYSGMLPGLVAGHYDLPETQIDLVRLARFAGARLVLGRAEEIDLAAREVVVAGRRIGFDAASIDVGVTSAMPQLEGFEEHGVPAKPLGRLARDWTAYRDGAGPARVAVIGGGVAGAELAMAAAHGLRHREAKVTVIDRERLLSETSEEARRLVRDRMAGLGVEAVEGTDVARVEAGRVVLADGREVASDFTIGAAGAKPQGWLAETGLAHEDGFVTVGPTLETSAPGIFAVGDCAHMAHDPRPKAGVYAVRQAPVLFDNLRAALSGGRLRDYRPQKDYLKLVSLGGKAAMAEKWGRTYANPLLWQWKDRIDRKFMRKLSDLPEMKAPKLPDPVAEGVIEALGDKPMCGGCGAKVGRGALREALAGLPPVTRDDVVPLPGDDAAVIRTGGARQVISTDHLRAMVEDPALMTRIAAIHALGDVWAMAARPQAATVSLILPRMSAEMQRRTMAEIMAAAREVMDEAGAAILGGHSSLGSELTVGFTVTGLCDAEPVTLAGAQPGAALILTKPIGSGTIMAAEMARAAPGPVVAEAWEAMVQPQGRASGILAGAQAMTDVTGFGLAGHLAGICEASACGAELRVADVPLMQGALELAEAGTRSTLFADNLAGAGAVIAGSGGARHDLMFDPQTAGGLLAAVAADQAEALLARLRAAGYPAAIVGRMTEGGGLRLV